MEVVLDFRKIYGGMTSIRCGIPETLSPNKNCVSADILSHSLSSLSWNFSFTRDLLERVSSLAPLLHYLKDVYVSPHDPDVHVWCPMSSGQFLVKTFFFILVVDPPSSHPFPIRKNMEIYGSP